MAASFSQEIYEQCVQIGVDVNKVFFLINNLITDDLNRDYTIAEMVLGKEYSNAVKNRYHMIRMDYDEIVSSESSGYGKTDMYSDDYVRIRVFELVAEEIIKKRVEGATAELGVFRGKFAKYINAFFPDRKCYLFDSFSGFEADEAQREYSIGNCSDAFIQYFKNTTIEEVLRIMPNPQNIVIKQGFFPESLHGLEERFAFVSIDVDFEKSIYDGLNYFYPRLNPGGYIFIHDYNHKTLKGVKKAVYAYEENNRIIMSKVPVCDVSGSLVITKGHTD